MGENSNRCKYEAEYFDYETNTHKIYECNNPSLNGNGYCMFHDREYVKQNPDKVLEGFLEILENAITNGDTLYCIGYNIPSFSIYILSEKVRELKFKKPVYFNHAHFLDIVDFSDAEFQVANFFDAKFQKAAYFSRAKFQKAYFSRAEFKGEVEFRYTKFPSLNPNKLDKIKKSKKFL